MAGGSRESQIRRFLQTSDGVMLSYIEAGRCASAENSPTIVLIPGWSMPATIWDRQLAYLGRRFHTVAFDPRGQGASQVAANGYTAERRAKDIEEFLDRLPRRVLLVGWSLGGIESLEYVHMFGTAGLAGMALVDSSVGENPAPPAGNRFFKELRAHRHKALVEFVRAIFAKPRSNRAIMELVRAAERMTLENSLELLEHGHDRSHWRNIARSFNKPLLYAVTRQYAAQARNLKRNRPATQVVIFPKAGHALFVDEPARFNRLIESFARQLDPAVGD